MMDRICCAVLEKILSLAPIGRYVVISEDEFFEAIPQDVENAEQELKKALKALAQSGYIDVKYSSGNLFCTAPLKKFEEPPKQDIQPTVPTVPEVKKDRAPILMFLSAFAGGVTGGLLITLLFWLINA